MKSLAILFFGMVLFLISFACSSSSVKCTGEVVQNGVSYTGWNKKGNKVQAQLNACNKYCLETDSQCETVYQIWLSSPKGKAGFTKQKALFEDSRLMDCVTLTCANKCVADIKAGSLQGKVTCD